MAAMAKTRIPSPHSVVRVSLLTPKTASVGVQISIMISVGNGIYFECGGVGRGIVRYSDAK